MDQAKKGAPALSDNDAATAVVCYTKALIEHPTSPDYFIQRSTAFARLKPPRHDLALKDAELAALYGRKRAKRASIQAAQHRRIVALYNAGRYAQAKYILQTTEKWQEEKDKKGKMEHDVWMMKINNKLKTAEETTPQAKEYPEFDLPEEKQMVTILKRQLKKDGSFNYDDEEIVEEASKQDSKASQSPVAAAIPESSKPAPTKIRHEWYQNNQSVMVTIYAKGVPKDKAQVEIQDNSVCMLP